MRIVASVVLLTMVAGCGAIRSPEFSPFAKITPVSTGCELMVEGLFPDMAHDPVTLILSGRSKIKAYFLVPALTGTFDASQIQVHFEDKDGGTWDVKSLSGTITFKQHSVKIDLIQAFPGKKPRRVDFNGNYNFDGTGNCR